MFDNVFSSIENCPIEIRQDNSSEINCTFLPDPPGYNPWNDELSIIFVDDFEEGDLQKWDEVIGDIEVKSSAAYSGELGVDIDDTGTIGFSVETLGRSGIELNYAREVYGYDAGEYLRVEWTVDGGSTWNEIETVVGTESWGERSISLPTDVANKNGS